MADFASPSSAAARDADLVTLLAQGQTERALELLLQRYEGKVYRLCLTYLGESGAAQDCTQDSLLRVWRGLAGYDARKAALSTWVYTITRNRCLSLLAQRGEAPLPLDDPQLLEELVDEHTDAAPATALAHATLQRLIATLAPPQQRALRLYYFEDRSVAEAALALGLPEATLKTHLHRGRAALREALRQAGLDDPRLWL